MCEIYGTKTRATPLYLRRNGKRFNRILEEYLRKVVSEQQKDWDEHIPRFLLAYRYTVYNSSSRSPAKVIFGTEIKPPGDLEFLVVEPTTERDDTCTGKEESLNELHEFVRTRIKMVSNRMKARYERATNMEDFHEGQLVLLYNLQRKKRLSKLQTSCDGPYKIIKRLNDVVHRIQEANSPRTKMKVAHIERLAKYGKEIMSLFGTNRLKWAAVLRRWKRPNMISHENNKKL